MWSPICDIFDKQIYPFDLPVSTFVVPEEYQMEFAYINLFVDYKEAPKTTLEKILSFLGIM